MALSLYQIKRWSKMLSGKSIDHVKQNIGEQFSVNQLRGYYNNLTEKVTKSPISLDSDDMPTVTTEAGEKIFFPVAIFQYGLGAYDLWLQTKDERYFKRFILCADWAVNNIDSEGRWNNFFFYNPSEPYGAMAQGEGASLLLRAYNETGTEKYLDKAHKAIDFMISPLEKGGTTKYCDGNAFLMEYTFKGMVLNGAIFAWWGLYDYVLVTEDNDKYKSILDLSLKSLIKVLPSFKYRVWSMYSLDGLIASPFYHNLHIAQMQAMFKLTGETIFETYAKLWKKQQMNFFNRNLAFIKKALQKIAE